MRGLDYYTRTVFEWITDATGAQNAVCSGGRYDGLIAQLGGEATPGSWFRDGCRAAGRRCCAAAGGMPAHGAPDVYVVVSGARAAAAGARRSSSGCADERPRLRFELNVGGGNFKAQFRRADKSGAALALIIGDDELARGVAAMKPLRDESGQSECPIEALAAGVEAALAGLGSG